MNDSKSLYMKACNVVDIIIERWSERWDEEKFNKYNVPLEASDYGQLVQNVATEIFKMDMYKNNIALVRSLSTDSDDSIHLDFTGEVPGDLSDLFDVFEDEEDFED
jgi:hypothetical protein